MTIEFRNVQHAPLHDINIVAPHGAVIGVVGEKDSGAGTLLRLAAGEEQPSAGEVIAGATRRYLPVTGPLNLAPADVLAIDHTFAQADALVRARAAVAFGRLRTTGTTVFIASHEPDLLRSLCDEVWWLQGGHIQARGNPDEVLAQYSRYIADKFRAWGETLSIGILPALQRGDGRAEILTLETLGSTGRPSAVLQSGEEMTVRVVVRFAEAVQSPVIGIMIRTRIGLEVYGTNTELERVSVGPSAAGESVQVEFHFRCDLCPKEYTLTAASHDPDGTAHDWLDDAISFLVTDSRFTAGVANLRARVNVTSVQADTAAT